jgi:thioredoxin-like negative regulator of GroEL
MFILSCSLFGVQMNTHIKQHSYIMFHQRIYYVVYYSNISPLLSYMTITKLNFKSRREFREYLNTNKHKLIIMKIYADWCSPCRAIQADVVRRFNHLKVPDEKKILLELAKDENPDVCSSMRIRAIPTIISFINGEPFEVHMGTDLNELDHFFIKSYDKYIE